MEWDELLALKMRQYFLPSDDKSHGLLQEHKNCTKKISVIKGFLPNLNYITSYAFVNRVGGHFQIKIQLTNKNGTSGLQKIL